MTIHRLIQLPSPYLYRQSAYFNHRDLEKHPTSHRQVAWFQKIPENLNYEHYHNRMKCTICKTLLKGRQTKYCSRKCHNQSGNKKHQDYACQQLRGRERKIKLVNDFGGECEICGYNRNYAALTFHHIEPSKKSFPLDLRHCSNKSWDSLLLESKKCQLLCIRCHVELHHPDFEVGPLGLEPRTKEL